MKDEGIRKKDRGREGAGREREGKDEGTRRNEEREEREGRRREK